MAKGWFQEPRRHAEAALKGRGGSVTPTERPSGAQNNSELLEKAYQFGEAGRRAGIKAPILDKQFMDFFAKAVKGEPEGTASPLLNAYQKGWNAEHQKITDKLLRDQGFYDKAEASPKTIYERIYQRLEDLGIIGVGEYARFVAPGFMDLHVDRIGKNRYALAHNYRHPSGDTIPDPDMEIQVFPETRMAEALSYQDTYGYQVVYPEPGKVNLKAKRELNIFLQQWLKNIKAQGHKKAEGG